MSIAKGVAALRATLGLEDADFQRGMQAAEARLGRFGSAARKLASGVAAAATTLGLFAGGLFVAAKAAIESADAIAKMAQRIGIGTDAMQELMYVASQSGVSVEALETGLRKLNDNIAITAMGKDNILRRLGIAAKDAAGNLRPVEAVLEDVADAFEKTNGGAAGTKILLETLGARAGTQFAAAMKDGAAGIRQLREEARSLGLVIEGPLLRGAESAGDALDRLRMIVSTNLTRLFLHLAPAIEGVAKALADAAPEIERIINALAGRLFGPEALSARALEQAIDDVNKKIEDTRRRLSGRRIFRGGQWVEAPAENHPALVALYAERERLMQLKEKADKAEEAVRNMPRPTLPAGAGGGARPAKDEMGNYLNSLRDSVRLAQAEEEERDVLAATLRAEAIARDQAANGQRASAALTESETQSIRAYVQLQRQAVAAEQERNALKSEAKSLTESLMSAEERHAETTRRLNEMRREGMISAQTFERAMKRADADLAQADVNRQALEGIADELGNAARGAATLEEGFKRARVALAQLVLEGLALGKGPLGGFFNRLLGGESGGALGNLLGRLTKTSSAGSGAGFFGATQSLLAALPGFANGGRLEVGGAGGIDSQVVAFRATPGEMVDIYKPGNDNGALGAPTFNLDLRGSSLTQAQVETAIDRALRAYDASLSRDWGRRAAQYHKLRGA